MSTCTPVRPFFKPYEDQGYLGWLFHLDPPLTLLLDSGEPQEVKYVAVHRDVLEGPKGTYWLVCAVHHRTRPREGDWGVPLAQASARAVLREHFDVIASVLELEEAP